MPRLPIDYSKGVIYKICCKDVSITDVYVGSTTNFVNRKRKHKSNCNNENQKVYQFIRDNGGWGNWDMVLIEECNCENKLQLLKKQREHMENLNSTLNSNIPTRTQKEYKEEYRKNNKETLSKYSKERYAKNKDKLTEKIDCEVCDIKISRSSKYTPEKSQNHIDNLNGVVKKEVKKITCEVCNCQISTFTDTNWFKHRKTQKHINNLNRQTNNIVLIKK